MGGNTFGQLGSGNKVGSDVPRRVPDLFGAKKVACGHHSAAITGEGKLYIWGTGVFGEFLSPKPVATDDSPIVDLSVGACFGIAIDSKGNAWTWGSNTSGELGTGDFESRTAPVRLLSLGLHLTRAFCGSAFVYAMATPTDHSPANRRAGSIMRVATMERTNFAAGSPDFSETLSPPELKLSQKSCGLVEEDTMKIEKGVLMGSNGGNRIATVASGGSSPRESPKEDIKMYRKELDDVKSEIAFLRSTVGTGNALEMARSLPQEDSKRAECGEENDRYRYCFSQAKID